MLFWGILGVIALGATLVSQFSWVRYIFGIFLVFTGIKMWVIADHVPDIGNNPILQLLKWHLRVTEGFRGNAKAQPNQRLSWACVTSSQVKIYINQQLTLEFLLPLNRQQVFENERHWMVILTIEPWLKVGKSGYTVSLTVKAKRHSVRQKHFVLGQLDFRTHTLTICAANGEQAPCPSSPTGI